MYMIHTMYPIKSFEIELLRKRNNPLAEQLENAVEKGLIQDRYEPFVPKQAGESQEEFVTRVRDFSTRTQFVNVALHGVTRFVAFGVPGPIVTRSGKFELVPAQVIGGLWGVHHCLFYPNLADSLEKEQIFLRLDSGCTSGQVFGDTTCDCKEQLDVALERCVANGCGALINIPSHDGRGWGEYKMANQLLMDALDVDTVAAARLFYGNESSVDQRSFDEAAAILLAFGFSRRNSFCLGTNNPRKIGAFHAMGLHMKEVAPIVSEHMNEKTRRSFEAKQAEWGHRVTP
jgi:GTP cyclohydrolase II